MVGQASAPPPGTIGAILVDAGRMRTEDAQSVKDAQFASDMPFGTLAVRMGLVSEADVAFALSQQFQLPCLPQGSEAADPEVIAAFEPAHALVERLRNLRGQIALAAASGAKPVRSIAIMSADRGAGRSYICANLATVYAQLGARTLLIDADHVQPRQHELFRLANRSGLSSILAGRATISAARPVEGLPHLAVLPAGPKAPNQQDLLARPALAQLLRHGESIFDIILIDTPAWREGHSARIVAAAAGAAIQVVEAGRTGATDAGALASEVVASGSRLLGVVVNQP